MSRDLTCDETMPSVDEVERRDGRRFFQQSVGVPIARIAPVVPSVALQQNSRQFVKTYIRSQANTPFPAGCSNGGQKMVHTYGTTTVPSTPQCATTVPGRSKLLTIRPVGAAHSFFKSYDISQLGGSPMTTVYLQQQHNLHLASAQQPILSLSSSRARELEDSRVIRSSATAFPNCGSIDSRRYLTSGRNIVGVGDVPVRSSVRVNPIISSAEFLRGTKVVTRSSDEKTDVKPIMLPAPTVNVTCPASATSIASLHDTCIPVPVGQHDSTAGTSYPGPSARPTILRKNRESGSVSAVRRLIAGETHPHTGPYQEVIASPLAAVKDNSGLMCFKRTSATDSRMLSGAPCISSDTRGLFARKTPAILIGNVVQNTKNFSDQVAVTGAVEVSPRKRLRKQNFECTNTEKMKLLISTERVVGDSFVTVKDELTWKSADFDCEARDDPVPEKVPRRRSRVRIDNGTGIMSLQQRVSTSVPHQISSDNYTKVKRMKKTQMVQRNKLSASGTSAVVELDSNSWSVSSFVNEKRTMVQYGRMEYPNAEITEAQVNEKWIEEAEVQKIEDITYLMCHIFGLKMIVPDDPCPNSRRFLHKSCDLSATFCFFGKDKVNGNGPSKVLSGETLSHLACNKQTAIAKEPVGSSISKSAITAGGMSNMQDDSKRNEVQYGQFTEQNRKVFAQMLLCSGLKDRWQRFDRISGCERVIKRIYVKRWMLQEHFRNTKQSVTADVELNSNLVASLEDYSLMAAKKQTEKFLESYPICSPSTSDNVFEKNVDSGSVYVYKYLEEALEVYTRNVSSNSMGSDHISPQRSIQAVAEVLAEIIEIVVENDKEGLKERNEQQHLGRRRKKKDDHLFEIKIADRFGIFELPHTMPQASNSVVALYDSISQYTLSRKRKSGALDADDAFFMNIEKELNRKKKRVGEDKNLSRTLHSLSQVRAVYQRLSDMRKAERDNLNEATKQMLNLVRYSDPTSYIELINGYKEDCQPYDNDSVREGKWQNRLLSFTKAVPPKIIPASRNYDANIAIKLHPPMNYTLRLFREKCIRPPKRFRSGMKRTRKSQSRRGRGRQRGSVTYSKKKSPTPEPQLEDLEPHFTVAEMGAMFKKEFGMDMRTFRYERCSQQELHSMPVDQEQSSYNKQEQGLEATEISFRSQRCTDCTVISGDPRAVIKNREAPLGNGNGGSYIGSSLTVPYIDLTGNDEISLLEHVQTRGRYIRIIQQICLTGKTEMQVEPEFGASYQTFMHVSST
ncbi:DNA ligase [Dirofilaria immitis]